MSVFIELEKVSEREYKFVLKRPSVYRGLIKISKAKDGSSVVEIEYTEPSSAAVAPQLREELDPYIIEKVIKEVLS